MNNISGLVGPSSWSLFAALDCNTEFLDQVKIKISVLNIKLTKIKINNSKILFITQPVEDWISNEYHLYSKKLIINLVVVNDAAERGVKLCHDFLGCCRYEKHST